MAKKKQVKIEAQKIQMIAVDELVPYVRNPKAHPPKQVNKIVKLIKDVGFKNAILVDKNKEIVAGHGRLLAAQKLGLEKVPVIVDETLTPEQARAFRIADNKVAESDWLEEDLTIELEELYTEGYDLSLTGFDMSEIDDILYHILPQETKEESEEEGTEEDYYSDEETPKEIKIPEKERDIDLYEWINSMKKIYVMFSGGKDSMALVADLLEHNIQKKKMILLHNRVPLDLPDLSDFVEAYAEKVGIELVMMGVDYTDEKLYKVLRNYGLPKGFTSRWCTRIWKIIPMNKWLKDNGLVGQNDIVMCQGFRREEGGPRENASMRAIQKDNRIRIARPILDYSEQEVFDIIKKYKWKLHPTYNYMKRLGCIYCFAIKRREWVSIRENNPEIFLRVIRFVCEAACSKNMSGDDIKYLIRKIMGLKTINKQMKEDGLIPKRGEKKAKKKV